MIQIAYLHEMPLSKVCPIMFVLRFVFVFPAESVYSRPAWIQK